MDKNLGRDELGIPGTNGTRRFEGGWPRFSIANYTTIGHSIQQHRRVPARSAERPGAHAASA